MKLSKGHKTFISGLSVGLIILALTLTWPYIGDTLWGKHSNTYVFAWGMNNSYTPDQLKEQAPIRAKINVNAISFPAGVSSVPGDMPLKLFNWTFSPGEKIYTLTAQNQGDGIARNVILDIDFTPNLISRITINNVNRMETIRGGENGSRAVFEIKELTPGEVQDVEILVHGNLIKSFNSWSETDGEIKNIYIFDISVEPDTNFTG